MPSSQEGDGGPSGFPVSMALLGRARARSRGESSFPLTERDSPASTPRIPAVWPFKNVYYGWALVTTAIVVSFAQVPMYGPVVSIFVKPIGDSTGWDRTTISLAFTIGSFGASLLSFLVGGLIDRYGTRVIVTLSGVGIALAMVGLSFITMPWQWWVLFGMGRAIAVAGINLGLQVGVSNWFLRYRGRALAFMAIGLRSGQALMPLVILPIIVATSWRVAYQVLAVIAMVFVVLPAAFYLRRRPEDLGLLPDGAHPGQAGDAQTQTPAGGAQRKTYVDESWTLQEALHTRAFWMIIVGLTAIVFAQTAVNLHIVANFEDRGLPESLSVTVVTIFAGTSAASALGWGYLVDHIPVRFGAILATLFFMSSMVIASFAQSYPLAVVFGLLFGMGSGGWTVLQTLIFADYFGRQHLGAIRGFAAPVMGWINPLGPLLAGYIRDATGSYTIAFITFFAIFGLVVVAMLLASPPRKRAVAG